MATIKVNEINNELAHLNNILSEYEDAYLNLFHHLDMVTTIDWKDQNSLNFQTEILHEKTNTEQILNNITDRVELYRYIANAYSNIGREISYNKNLKNNYINKIDNYINMIDDILYQFRLVDISFNYDERNQIINAQNRVKNIRNQLVNLKANINSFFNRINQIEADVNQRIGRLSTAIVGNFNL